jgi:hypothetical protein
MRSELVTDSLPLQLLRAGFVISATRESLFCKDQARWSFCGF